MLLELYFFLFPVIMITRITCQDSKVHLYQWDGKSLEDDAVPILQGNKAVVSALAFSPDGNLLASGDVSSQYVLLLLAVFLLLLIVNFQSSGSISLFDIKEKKVISSVVLDI